MERWQMLNRGLAPVDQVFGVGLDLLKKVDLYEPFKENLYRVSRKALEYNFKTRHRLEVLGAENVPPTGGCLIAANHQSWLDVQVLASSSPRRFHFVAKAEFREWPILRRLIELNESIYVRRGGDERGLEEIAQAVREGKAVVIFPEGTIPGEEDIPRWEVEPDTGLLRGKTGVVRIALATGAPIIPCGISGTGRAFPPEAYPRLQSFPPLPRPEPITIRYGRPIRFEKPEHEPSREDLARMTKEVMRAISALVDHSRDYEPIQLPIERKTRPTTLPRYAYRRSPAPAASEGEGGESAPKAPLGVLVLHGFTSDIHCVDPLVAPLDRLGLPYRFPILRGHGTHYRDMVGTTARDWYEDAENALLDLAGEVVRVVVVGLSMGGLVALELAARHRDIVGGVVTVAAALRFQDPLAGLAPFLSKVVHFWPSPNAYNDPELRRRENRNYPKFATDAFASLYAYSREIPNLLSFVKAPILVLHSKRDQVIAPRSAEIIHEKVSSKDRSLIWFERSGHEMLLDCEREAVVTTIMEFIERIRASQG